MNLRRAHSIDAKVRGFVTRRAAGSVESLPPGFGVRQSSAAFSAPASFQSGRGLPHSTTLPRQPESFVLVGARRCALTLLEMMVAITLLAVIMVGLVAMFNQTQKALHVANAQTDIFENMRAAIQMIGRDLTEMAAFDDINVTNAYAFPVPSPIPGGVITVPSSPPTDIPLDFDETFWLTRVNDTWQGIGYFVDGTNFGVGTLYRYAGAARRELAPSLLNAFLAPFPTNTYRVSDGVVHFTLTAAYPAYGDVLGGGLTNYYVPMNRFVFASNALPAYVDVELGFLEPAMLKQFHSLTDNVAVAQNFLRTHVGNIHFFRERVPIRNFINPYRSNEVP